MLCISYDLQDGAFQLSGQTNVIVPVCRKNNILKYSRLLLFFQIEKNTLLLNNVNLTEFIMTLKVYLRQ